MLIFHNRCFISLELPSDCSGWFDKGQTKSGIYAVKPNQSEAFNVYCDMSSGRSNSNSKFQSL